MKVQDCAQTHQIISCSEGFSCLKAKARIKPPASVIAQTDSVFNF